MSISRPARLRTPARLIVTAALALFGGGLALTGTAQAVVVQPCSPSFIGVPGSGQNHNGTMSSVEMTTVQAFIASSATHAGLPLRNSTILKYPAVPPTQYSAPTVASFNLTALDTSETTGQANLTNTINSDRAQAAAAGCANAPILLAGYSQGAEVVIRTVDALPAAARATVSVALLGDPSFVGGVKGDLDLSSAAYRGIRPSFTGGKRFALTSDVLGRTLDLCASSDGVCAYHLSLVPSLFDGRNAHFHYTSLSYQGLTLAAYAGDYLFAHRAAASPDPRPATATGRIIISPCLNLRAGPNGSTALIGCVPDGLTISIQCTAQGNGVTGPYGTETIWDRTTYNGYTGYVSDAYVYTGTNSAVAGAC